MTIFDSEFNIVKNPNLNLGYVLQKRMPVFYIYVVDTPEVTHEEVVAEYPETGGKDIRIVVDVPEKGHWEVQDESGGLVKPFDGEIPENLPHDVAIPDIWTYSEYIPYTKEEIAEREELIKQEEEAARAEEERQAKLDALPAQMEDADAAICELYETSTAHADIIAEQDIAICELYEGLLNLSEGK